MSHFESHELSQVAGGGVDSAIRNFITTALMLLFRNTSICFSGFHFITFGEVCEYTRVRFEGGVSHFQRTENSLLDIIDVRPVCRTAQSSAQDRVSNVRIAHPCPWLVNVPGVRQGCN